MDNTCFFTYDSNHLGESVNGKPRVSKTRTGGSIPSSPAYLINSTPFGVLFIKYQIAEGIEGYFKNMNCFMFLKTRALEEKKCIDECNEERIFSEERGFPPFCVEVFRAEKT